MKTLKQAQQKNEIEQAINSYLESIGVSFTVYGAGVGLVRDCWECDGWRAEFRNKTGVVELFDYFTGIGHRVIFNESSYKREQLNLKGLNPHCIAAEKIRKQMAQYIKPFPPFAASVLHCLILDSSADDMSFSNWCDDYGYDTDSIKTLTVYNACCDNAKRLRKIFTRDQIEQLREVLQDY